MTFESSDGQLDIEHQFGAIFMGTDVEAAFSGPNPRTDDEALQSSITKRLAKAEGDPNQIGLIMLELRFIHALQALGQEELTTDQDISSLRIKVRVLLDYTKYRMELITGIPETPS